MLTVHVDLGDRSYPIAIGAGLFGDKAFAAHVDQTLLRQGKIVIITNDVVAPLYLDKVKAFFAGRDCAEIVLADGEANKTLGAVDSIYEFLLSNKYDRHTTLVALGGGVVGDITGFAAATYLRGIDFVQIPTTLLAQVDSSVGGKTGVNHPLGKNMIGAFYQPRCVIADTDVLSTLPSREIKAGLAEVIKYGLIRDSGFFHWLGERAAKLVDCDPALMAEVIQTCCRVKAQIVAEDERESGVRALLNLGHTFGHALEAFAGYSDRLLHGEAISIGMRLAFTYSVERDLCTPDDAARAEAHFKAVGLPTDIATIPGDKPTPGELLRLMAQDKKVAGGKLVLVLVKGIGQAFIEHDVSMEQMTDFLKRECARR